MDQCYLSLLQEIYPPKLVEFAYVTDGACTEDEILDQELVILKVSYLVFGLNKASEKSCYAYKGCLSRIYLEY